MSPSRRHRVAVLVLPGVLPLEFGAATQIFARDPHYDLAVCAEARTVPGSGFTITTAAGLAAAIPAAVFYNFYASRIKVLSSMMDDFALEFLNIVERNFT